jgi:FkbH-like protein
MKSVTLRLISDFNVEPLGRYLRNVPGMESEAISTAPFGQVYPSLAKMRESDKWGSIIWTLAEKVIPHFSSAFNLEDVDHAEILHEVDHFADSILAAGHHQRVFVVSWVVPSGYSGYGMLDWRPGLGIRHLLAEMNLRLADRLARASNIYLLDAERWLLGVPHPESPQMWYATKVPYVPAVFERAAADIVSAIEAIQGTARRLIVLDLDNTIWGGVVGETGWEGIRLGGHDHIGEAYKDFQRELKSLSQRGIQLAIVSKNDESVALQAIDKHPEMLLRRNDFAGWRINWHDKAANVAALIEELNLGLASAVFIDDNPAERDRVAKALPELVVPEWPKDPTAYVSALRMLNCFNVASITKEDRSRKAEYVANRARRDVKYEVDSPDEWLHRLGTRVRVSRVSQSNISRVTQLFNKTNQLNLSTRRMSETEILKWTEAAGHAMLAISVSDHFGDMGLVGIIGVEAKDDDGKLVDYILSCRVMGRKVEETLIYLAVTELAKLGANKMAAQYLPTARNRPTLDVFHSTGLKEISAHRFTVDIKGGFPIPKSIALDIQHD